MVGEYPTKQYTHVFMYLCCHIRLFICITEKKILLIKIPNWCVRDSFGTEYNIVMVFIVLFMSFVKFVYKIADWTIEIKLLVESIKKNYFFGIKEKLNGHQSININIIVIADVWQRQYLISRNPVDLIMWNNNLWKWLFEWNWSDSNTIRACECLCARYNPLSLSVILVFKSMLCDTSMFNISPYSRSYFSRIENDLWEVNPYSK